MDFFKQNIIPAEVFIQLAAFLIVFFTLRKFGWGPIQKSLADRREHIRKSIDDADKAKHDMEKLKAEYELHLKQIEEQTRAKMAETIEAGRSIAKEMQDKAREEAQRTFDKTKAALDLEVSKARVTMRREIADISIHVAEKVLRENLTEAKLRDKASQLVDELEKTL
ncbi:MAG TPA: ATP synthase F0 subunit B [Candidatus Omnitrophica bacterium]|nr:ATP synthase F0 subunit B [Candidatus Omnitrophota bacterium]